jgi:hypothetical protein
LYNETDSPVATFNFIVSFEFESDGGAASNKSFVGEFAAELSSPTIDAAGLARRLSVQSFLRV